MKCTITFSSLQDYISLIPKSYLRGDKLVTVARLPCTVFGNSEACVKYSYLSIPRKDFYTIEIESTGRQDAEMLDRSLYPSLNINGAILLRNNKVCLLFLLALR